MHESWQALLSNLAVAGLAISIWAHLVTQLPDIKRIQSQALMGATLGFGAVISMLIAIQIAPGVFIDLRSAMIAIAAMVGGPVAAVIAGSMTLACRINLGGQGMLDGVFAIIVITAAGTVLHYTLKNRGLAYICFAVLAVVVSALLIAMLLVLPALVKSNAIQVIGLPLLVINNAAILLCGLIIVSFEKKAVEQKILRSAFAQAPDFFYIKDLDCKFVAVNNNTALHNKFSTPAAMVGLDDFAINRGPHAEELFFAELEMMRSGISISDKKGTLLGKVYSTSKVPLRDADGEVIGLAGVTKDITETEQLYAELAEYRSEITQALEAMPEGFAMISKNGSIIRCNQKFQSLHPITCKKRVDGANIFELIDESIAVGEYVNFGVGQSEPGRQLRSSIEAGDPVELNICDGTWYALSAQWYRQKAVIVLNDITAIKNAEELSRASAELFRAQATVDALTSVLNRRAFDEVIDAEARRSTRSHSSLAVLMIDIDNFKAYNDTYGHQEGDKCLKQVAACMKASLRRPTDVAARYGGEEFAIILPDTDQAGALEIAESFRGGWPICKYRILLQPQE